MSEDSRSIARANQYCLEAFVGELARSGVRHACVSPGSRSTPITLALVAHPSIRCYPIVDERQAGFVGLGLAKATGETVVLVCTSGTAGAHWHPALVEARLAGVPLLALTADRPPEMHGRGASQTVEQHGFFGTSVKEHIEAGLPDERSETLAWFRHLACRAVQTCVSGWPGPVQVNMGFREPLLPQSFVGKVDEGARTRVPVRPFTQVHQASPSLPSAGTLRDLVEGLSRDGRGILVCGSGPFAFEGERVRVAVAEFAAVTGWPVIAEAASQVRFGVPETVCSVGCAEAIVRDTETAAFLCPSVVVRLGGWPLSKPIATFLRGASTDSPAGVYHRHVHLAGVAGWSDPEGVVTDLVLSDAVSTLRALAQAWPRDKKAADWGEAWQKADRCCRTAIERVVEEDDFLHEGQVVSTVVQEAGPGGVVWVAASMPLRDIDTYTMPFPESRVILANRGANGIDGLISAAVGAGLGMGKPVSLVCGDVAFAHDVAALALGKRLGARLTLVVLDNGGGRIFAFLPQARMGLGRQFHDFFTMPPGLDMAAAATMASCTWVEAASEEALRKELRVSSFPGEDGDGDGDKNGHGQVRVIRVPLRADRTVAEHQLLWEATAAALRDFRATGER